jgi:trehalose-6-phosphatase
VDAELGAFQSKELVNELAELLKREPYTILRGNKVVEVRHIHCTKGRAVEELLRRNPISTGSSVRGTIKPTRRSWSSCRH